EVYSFAGSLRGRDQHVGAGANPGESCFYQRIGAELDRLGDHVKELLGRASKDVERAAAIALYHMQFELIHPFRDGNGRTGRVIAEAQTRALLHRQPEPIADRSQYMEAIRHAQDKSDLGPLYYVLTGLALP